MKTDDLLILGAAGVAVYLILKSTGTKTATAVTTTVPKGSTGTVADWVGEIFNANGTPYDNGWRYYENGVAIDPSGNYWLNGQKVWTA